MSDNVQVERAAELLLLRVLRGEGVAQRWLGRAHIENVRRLAERCIMDRRKQDRMRHLLAMVLPNVTRLPVPVLDAMPQEWTPERQHAEFLAEMGQNAL